MHTPFLHPSLPTKLWGWGLVETNETKHRREIYENVIIDQDGVDNNC